MVSTLTKNYFFTSFMKNYGKENTYKSFVKAVFYQGIPGNFGIGSDKREIFNLDLDDEDIEYLRKKYILTELDYKKQELEETLQNVEILRIQIKSIEDVK